MVRFGFGGGGGRPFAVSKGPDFGVYKRLSVPFLTDRPKKFSKEAFGANLY